eukprot:gene9589-2547_t
MAPRLPRALHDRHMAKGSDASEVCFKAFCEPKTRDEAAKACAE